MKQTAVEWLYERFLFAGFAANSMWKEKAKEMEKEQIIKAHLNGQSEWDIKALEDINFKLANEYYNETYGDK